MMIEADTSIIQEVVTFLSGKEQCRITNLSLSEATSDNLFFPGLEIRLKEQMVYRDNMPVPMTYHEFHTLTYLASHPGWVFSKAQIYEAVWKAAPEHCGAAVANAVYSLRRKNGDGYIETVAGSGYRFVGV